jgi:hypothetical protein
MIRAAVPLALLVAILLCLAPAAEGAEWRSEQPVGEGGFVSDLGEVGDIECWNGEANRCLLISAGNKGVAAGVFAYDGSGWYRYSTVCGGHEGRIAWGGPDEFWTVSDQQAGQQIEGVSASAFYAISLCHFKDGRVAASYGEPIGAAGSYLHINAAACAGPADCWFAGERLPGSINEGAFHLHWNGSSLTALPSLGEQQSGLLDPGRSVTGLALHGGSFYEGVRVAEGDAPVAGEEAEPSFLHRLAPASATPFQPLFPAVPLAFGEGAEASELGGFRLSDEGQRLWAVSGVAGSLATVTVLQIGEEGSVQLPLEDPEGVLEAGDPVSDVAAEPGRDDAWIGFMRAGEFKRASTAAHLTRIQGDGTVDAAVTLPAEGEGVERSGPAGPLSCPEPEQCWMATERGWLFHLGPDPAPNEDPLMHGPVITVRPTDDSVPVVPPVSLPEDNSGAESEKKVSDQEELPSQLEELPRRRPAIVSGVKQRLVHGTTLELSFLLREKAHVQLLARRGGAVVAKTRRYTMAKGRRSLRLPLDPQRWPTKLDLEVQALAGRSK